MGFSETPNSPWDSWEEAAGPFAALSRSVMSPDICEHITVISQDILAEVQVMKQCC